MKNTQKIGRPSTLLIFGFLVLSYFSLQAQTLYVNEFMASNSNTIADEAGEFEDWIEIYNGGAADIDLAGYYMSDDPADITLWQIPATDPTKTTVPAGGYLILWADKDVADGENHVNIKLGAGGESVVLTAPDGITIIDQITFGPQSEDVSYGRETDGAANLVFFTTPTPGAANIVSGPATYTVSLEIPISSSDEDGEQFPGGGVTLSSSDIEMVQDGSLVFTAAYRFSNIPLPEQATITNAFLQFYVEEVQTGPADINITADAAANATPLVSSNSNFSSRTTTTNAINWIPSPWAVVGANDVDQQTPDLSTVIQEVVGLAEWQAGNSLVFLMTGSGTRTTYSYDANPEKAAVLHIEAEVPLPTDPIDPVFINELAATGTTYEDASGKREDWIELYNPNPTDVNVGGLFLTDDYGNLDKWQIGGSVTIPAGGYVTFFADDDTNEGVLHTSFKLKSGGEEVALVQQLVSGLTIIDSISFGEMPFLASYGRVVDGGNTWQLFGEITPEATNNGALPYLAPPDFSLSTGFYTGVQTLSLSHPLASASIYYTTDGSLPDVNGTLYTGPITINTTGSIRAMAILSGYTNSQPKDVAYMIDENPNMSVLYLTTDPDNFFDDEIGIYVDGTNGVAAYCSSVPVNWAQDWERPCNLKMFLPDGTVAFDVNAGVEISGACSRGNAMKSLAINLREKEFGDGSLKYELFPQREGLEDYQRIKLRGSGQDYYRLGFRDMLNQTLLFKDIDIEAQAGRPSLLYLNGEFWGIYNIREKYAGEHFEELYGVKEKDLDIIKSPGLPYREVKKGSDADYNMLFDFVENADFTNQADYDYFDTQVDVNEFTNYWIAMTYMANYDWPANNLTIWRDRVNQSKWRYGVADTDGSTNNFLNNNADTDFNTFDFINDANSTSWPNHKNSTLFLRKLLDRPEYRDEFIQRTCTFIEVIFNEERTHPLIDSIVGLFQPNLQAHLDKWAYSNAMGGSEASWNQWIGMYKDFWEGRPAFMRQHINDFYGLNNYYDLTINFDASTEGDVFVNANEMSIPYNYTGTYFKDIPLRLTAVADEGYQFAYWLETGVTDAVIDFVANGNTVLTPIFVADGPQITCPENINVTVSGAATSAVVNWTTPSATSACTMGNVIVTQTGGPVSGSNFPIGSTTITYEATDGCGISATCSFDVTVVLDNGVLNLACPDEIAINIPVGMTETIVNWTEPTVNSTCPLGGEAATQTQGIMNGGLFSLGTTTITYEANDLCGNIVICSFNVVVTADNGVLILTCPVEVIVDALPGASNTMVSWTEPTVTTTCGLGGASATQTLGPPNGGSFPLGSTEVAYQAADDCANLDSCFFMVIVNNTPSTVNLMCPADTTVNISSGNTGETISWIEPIGTSDCVAGTVTTNQTVGMPSGSFFPIGVHTITYETTDGCGMTETCSFTITVLDSPGTLSLACLANSVFVLAPGETAMAVSWSLPTVSTTCGGGPQNPNCGTVPAGFSSIGTLNGQEYLLSNNKKTWPVAQADCETYGGYLTVVGDAVENQFLLDNISNTIHIGLHDVNTEGVYEWLNGDPLVYTNYSSNPNNNATNDYWSMQFWDGEWNIYSDLVWKHYVMELDCGSGSAVTLTQTGGPTNGSVLTEGIYTITYEATDDCGDIQVCTTTVEVQANAQAIVITCPDNITVTEVPGTGEAVVTWSDATATTNCATGGLSVNQTSGVPSGSTFPIGTHTITYEATDICGNLETCSFVIEVEPDVPATDYCEVEGSAPWQQWISNVTFNAINNNSGKDKYGDFTFISTSVDPGASYTFSLTPAFSWEHWDEYIRVWIDYNGDFDFDDPGEKVFEAIIPKGTNGTPAAPAVGTITIPTNSPAGTTRMRVAMKKEAFAEPCETFTFGEVEDYTVEINSNGNNLLVEDDSELLFFSAMKNRVEVNLNWETNTEYKNDFFLLERSLNGTDFYPLKKIESIYETTQTMHYQAIDEAPHSGVNYYRLQQIDEEGNVTYSKIRQVIFEESKSAFLVFPNPAQEDLYVNLRSYTGEQATIQIYNALGQMVEMRTIEKVPVAVVYFDLSAYKNGLYLVSVEVENRKRMKEQLVVSRKY